MKYINISIEENIFLKADVISLRDLDGKEFIYYREVQKLASGSGKSNVYIAFTDEAGITNDGRKAIALQVQKFFKLINITIIVRYYLEGTKMDPSLITRNDVISIVSKRPRALKKFIMDNPPLKSRYDDSRYDCPGKLDNFISGKSLEMGLSEGENITIVSTDKISYSDVVNFRCVEKDGSKNKMIAF